MGRTDEAIGFLERYAAFAGGDEAEGIEELIATLRGERPGRRTRSTAPEPAAAIYASTRPARCSRSVSQITNAAVREVRASFPEDLEDGAPGVIERWAYDVRALGLEIKGLWLVDFDSGAGYYCWKYPEPALDHFHGYEEGFSGRLQIT